MLYWYFCLCPGRALLEDGMDVIASFDVQGVEMLVLDEPEHHSITSALYDLIR